MPRIGASDLYLARELSDDENGATYDVPIALKKRLMKIGYDPSVGSADLEADDQVVDTITALGLIKITINATDLTLTEKAYIFGQTIVNGIRQVNKNDNAPYIAVLWRSLKSNGKYRYEKLYKVKFSESKEEFETKKKSPGYQTPTIEGTAIPRIFDGKAIDEADEDEPTFIASVRDNWFTSVNLTTDNEAPTISSTTPANNANNVAANATFKWTFSEAILPSSVNSANFFVIKDSDGSIVAGALTQSTDKKAITFTPSANLAAATAYRAITTMGVKDLSNNALVDVDVRKFTTV